MPAPDTIQIVLNSMSIFLSVFAIIGNALVCHVIVRLKTMKTSINYIILNLAILDTISSTTAIYFVFLNDKRGVLVEPILERAYNQSSVLADVMCKIELCYWLPSSISPPLLMIMAYERYKAIVDPLSRLDRTVTRTRLKWMLPLAWVAGFCFSLPNMSMLRYDENQGQCNYKWLNFEVYATLWLITQYIIPSTVMLIFYSRAICSLRRQDNVLGPQVEAERVRRKAKKKVMRAIIAVTLVFYLACGLPQILFVLASAFFIERIKSTVFPDTMVVLLAVNFAFNPCAYFLFIQSFRDGFLRLFMSQRDNTSRSIVLAASSSSRCTVGGHDKKESSNPALGSQAQVFNVSQNNKY